MIRLAVFIVLGLLVALVNRRTDRRGNGSVIRKMAEEVKTHAATRKQQLEELTRFKSEHSDATRPIP